MTFAAVPMRADDLGAVAMEPSSSGEQRLLAPGETTSLAATVETLLHRATAALDELHSLDLDGVDADTSETLVIGTERLRRSAEAATIAVARHVEATQPFRADGYFSTVAYLKHRIQLSGVEAFQRVQMARRSDVLDRWVAGHEAGVIGSAQFRLMARIASNPRIDAEVLEQGSQSLWCDALDCSYATFERRARTWELLADPQTALDTAERTTARRDASITPLASGGWALTARLDDIGGAEFNEVFAHFVEAAWRADWKEATERRRTETGSSNPEVTVHDLRRTEAQRRADALVAAMRSAAAHGTAGGTPPTVDLLIDHDTARSIVLEELIDPGRYRSVVTQTASGVPIHPRSIMNTALWSHIRRVVTDAAGAVIDLGRRSRLFTGPAREAVMLLETSCVWVGCDHPTEWCDADHCLSWKAHGNSVPRNGAPLCRRHNVVKEQGFRIQRDPAGDWHTFGPDGHQIF